MPLARPGPCSPTAQVPDEKAALSFPLSPTWEVMQIPSVSEHGPNVPPGEAGGHRGEHSVPQLPYSTLGCQSRSPPSNFPFPHPGKPGLCGQMGQSCSGSKSSPAPHPVPSFQGLLWPSAPAGWQPEWLPSLRGPFQAGGRDTGGITQGCSEGSSPSAIPGIGVLLWNSSISGAPHPIHCQVYFVPAAVH